MQVHDYALMEIEKILLQNGQTLANFVGMPTPNPVLLRELSNGLLNEELNYDVESMRNESVSLLNTMNTG